MKVLMNGLSIRRPVDSPNSITHIFLPGNAELKWSRKSLFESPTLESQTTFFPRWFYLYRGKSCAACKQQLCVSVL